VPGVAFQNGACLVLPFQQSLLGVAAGEVMQSVQLRVAGHVQQVAVEELA